jgi:hypothetical protein
MTEHTTTAIGSASTATQQPGPRPRLTARPETFAEHALNSSAVWLGLMAYWALADTLIAIFPPGGRPFQPEGWLTHLVLTLAGLVAIWATHRTGFPAAWDARISATRRLLLPLLVGVAGGLLAIAVELVGGASTILAAQLGGELNVAFPGSLLVYSAGAITMEMLYLLLPVPLLLWLISGGILRGRGQAQTFWVLALLSSAAEPLLQGTSIVLVAGGALSPLTIALYAVESFSHNLASAIFFRRYGILAAILVRLGHYMVWHVIYGNFIA